jgi:hypothetical protein
MCYRTLERHAHMTTIGETTVDHQPFSARLTVSRAAPALLRDCRTNRIMPDRASWLRKIPTMLTLEAKTRRRYPALALTALLGLAVFIWGLHYKLSLYQTAGIHQTVPAAKLLSQKERPASSFKIESRIVAQRRPQFLSRAIPFHQHWAFLTAASPQVADLFQKLVERPSKCSTRQLWHSICNSARPPPPIAI